MGCSTCGKVTGCGCGTGCGPVNASQVILNPIPSGVRSCSPLSNTCGVNQPATPSPYYECSPQCEENHCQEIVYNFYAASICTQFAFNMPDCSETANVYFQGVKVLPVGAYLWHETYGYLEVTSFNNQTGLATLLNNCNEGNAAVGTNVPACTCFVVTDPPSEGEVNPFVPYVAEDFTAPPDTPGINCVTITVTTVAGLVAGGTVTIATGIYVIDSILSPTSIIICNEGDGITAGTVVEARNEAGQLQYPITQIGVNPCSDSATPSTTGTLVVCVDGQTTTLDGASTGMVPVLVDATTNEVEFQTIADPCASVTAVAEGALLVCASGEQRLLDSTDVGTVVVCSNATTNTYEAVDSGLNAVDDSTAPQSATVAPGNGFFSNTLSYTFTNPNPNKILAIHIVADISLELGLTLDTDYDGELAIDRTVNAGPYTDLARRTVRGDGAVTPGIVPPYGQQLVGHETFQVAPGGSITLEYRGSLSNTGGGGTDTFDIDTFVLKVSAFMVAI